PEEAGEGADVAQDLGPVGPPGEGGEPADRLVAGLDVDPGPLVRRAPGPDPSDRRSRRRPAPTGGPPSHPSKRASCDVSSRGNPTSYSPLKQAWQKGAPSPAEAFSMPSSERYPTESAPRYRQISSTRWLAPISSLRVGVSMP